MDANTNALNVFMDRKEEYEKYLDLFIEEVDSRVQDMEDIYFELRKIAYYYVGYDFSNELKEEIESRLNISLKDKKMKTTVEGVELWNLEEVAKSSMHGADSFRITVAMVRKLYNKVTELEENNRYLLGRVKELKDNETSNGNNRFVVIA